MLKWAYEKDINNIEGADAAWLDNIVFPPASTVLGVNNIIENNSSHVYPNPATNQINIVLEKGQVLGISAFNLMGSRINFPQPKYINNQTIQLDISSLETGIYMVEIVLENQKIIKKLIVK